jgi:hypothetical protein
MNRFRLLLTAAALAFAATAAAQTTPADVKLPVHRVVLFKNGIGYFEHSGRVHDNQQVSVSFTTAQLDDVLKSLTVLDLGEGRITDVSYNSIAPVEQRLKALRLPVGEDTTQAQFLAALRGAKVEVRSGTAVLTGRLLSVEKREVKRKDESTTSIDSVSVVTDGGEVRTFDLTPATSVRVLERDLNEEIGHYLNVVASTREQDVRRMTINTAGTGDRDLFVSYISEVPVWKSTYRVVLPQKADDKAILQGWAIVDNTVGEDWRNVQLSLVTGAPQSFIEQLSTPYYARRPVVPLPQTAMLTPQTHEQTLEVRDRDKLAAEMPPPPPPPPLSMNSPIRRESTTREAITRSGGTVGGPVGGVGPGWGGGIGAGIFKSKVTDAFATQEAAAQARDLGDLFEYQLEQPVTIRKNQSALVPIVQARVDAEKVTLWSPSIGRPVRALWMTNSSGLTLDGGSFNVLESNTFAGEGLLDPIRPGDKRLLSYAIDLGVLVDPKNDTERQRVSRVWIARGVLTQTTEVRERRTYTVRNEDVLPREVVIEHPVRAGMKFAADSPRPVESTASFHRFRITAEPKKTATLKIEEFQPQTVTYELTNLSDDQIALFVRQHSIDAEMEKALRRILEQKNGVAELEHEMETRRKEISSIFDDQQRVRENLKALKGSAEEKELTQRYTRQLNQQEDQVQALRNEVTQLQHKRDQAKAELDRAIEELSLEAKLGQ